MTNAPNQDNTWQGFTFEELQYQKVLTAARISAQQQRLNDSIEMLRQEHPLSPAQSLRKIFNALSVVDYMVMGMKIVRRLRPLFSKK